MDVECYVLNDPSKTAVISQSGFARALGLSPRGNVLARFTASQAMVDFVGAELLAKLENPLSFQWGSGGAEQPPSAVKGFDAALLIDLCNAIAAASSAGRLSGSRPGTRSCQGFTFGAAATWAMVSIPTLATPPRTRCAFPFDTPLLMRL